jgi:hypothetical protein
MKNTLIIFILIVLSSGFTFAQTIIPKAGVSIAKVNVSDAEMGQAKATLGFTLGAAVNFPINDIFSFQPELVFIQKGFKVKEDFSFGFGGFSESLSLDAKVVVNYLEVPVLAKATFGTNTKFHLIAGPSLGIGLGGKYRYEYHAVYTDGNTVEEEHVEADGKVKFGDPENETSEDLYLKRRADFGFQIGGGLLVKEKILIDLRYGIGITNLGGGFSSDEDSKVQNRVLQITVGIPLALK